MLQIPPTAEISFPWSRPPVARVYLTPRARLRRARNRFLASAFVADVRSGYRRSLAIVGAIAIAYGCLVVIRGAWFAALLIGVAK
jgi:hypothetical protein